MTTHTFCTIRELSEIPEGLLIQHRDGQTSLLRRDHERYARIEELLRDAHGMSVVWPVRIARSSDGVIVNAWVAWGGRPVYIEDLAAATECVVYFSLQNEPKTVKHDNPDYPRMLETLMKAAGSQRDVFYFMQPGEKNVLVDVCLAN
jgi:hypothetical protein